MKNRAQKTKRTRPIPARCSSSFPTDEEKCSFTMKRNLQNLDFKTSGLKVPESRIQLDSNVRNDGRNNSAKRQSANEAALSVLPATLNTGRFPFPK